MNITAERQLDDGVVERDFTVGEVPGVLWTPLESPSALILSGHNGGLHKREPRLVARARYFAAEYGFAVAAIDAPGCGERPRTAADDALRADLREAMAAGAPIEEIVDAMVVPLVELAAPEWQAVLDAMLSRPELDVPVGYTGMNAVGIRLGVSEPRIRAAVLFGMSLVPAALREEARSFTLPLQLLLQWDDERMDRQHVLDLFDAFGSEQKTLHANTGGHTGTPWFETEDSARFFARHLC